jgi:hypothetical protein
VAHPTENGGEMFEQLEDLDGEKAEEEKPTDYTGLIVVVMTLPVIMVFAHIGKFTVGLNIAICLGMNTIAVKSRLDLRRHIWFWVVAVLTPAIEIPLVMNIQWPHRWVSHIELLPIGFAVVMIMLGAIWLAEKIFPKSPHSDEDEGSN